MNLAGGSAQRRPPTKGQIEGSAMKTDVEKLDTLKFLWLACMGKVKRIMTVAERDATIEKFVTTYSEQIKDDPVLESAFTRWQAQTMGISETEIQWLSGKVDTQSFTKH